MLKMVGILLILCICLPILFIFWATWPQLAKPQFKNGDLLTFNVTPKPSSTDTFSVLTYNLAFAAGLNNLDGSVHSLKKINNNLTRIEALVQNQNPDILCVQEIDLHSKRSQWVNQVEALAKACNFPYVAVAYTWDCRWVPYPLNVDIAHQFGPILAAQAIFSKYPLSNHRILRFKKPSANLWIYNLFYLDRIAHSVTCQTPQGPVNLVNVHLEAFDANTRELQFKTLATWIQNQPETSKPSLVMGDFNAGPTVKEPSNPLLALTLQLGFKSIWNSAPPIYTYPSNQPEEQLDHIVYNPSKWGMVSKHVLDAHQASDHLAVYTCFRRITP